MVALPLVHETYEGNEERHNFRKKKAFNNSKNRSNQNYYKEEDRDDYIEPRRVHRPRQKIELPDRNIKRAYQGMGGHMTAALIQEMMWYDHLIMSARINVKNAITRQQAVEDNQRLDTLLSGRSRYMGKRKERLIERGYYGPFPSGV